MSDSFLKALRRALNARITVFYLYQIFYIRRSGNSRERRDFSAVCGGGFGAVIRQKAQNPAGGLCEVAAARSSRRNFRVRSVPPRFSPAALMAARRQPEIDDLRTRYGLRRRFTRLKEQNPPKRQTGCHRGISAGRGEGCAAPYRGSTCMSARIFIDVSSMLRL